MADVQHVGSTGIGAGLSKGDLDICVRVPPADFVFAKDTLAELYARNHGSDSTATFAAFSDTDEWVGVQLCVAQGPEDNFVRLRDMLRECPRLLAAYDDIKRRHHGGDMDRYRHEKSAFIERVLHATPDQPPV